MNLVNVETKRHANRERFVPQPFLWKVTQRNRKM